MYLSGHTLQEKTDAENRPLRYPNVASAPSRKGVQAVFFGPLRGIFRALTRPEYANDGYAPNSRALLFRTRKAATGPRITASHPSHTTIDAMPTLLSGHYP